MKVVIAPDSFKECLAAEAVAEAMARGVRAAAPDDARVAELEAEREFVDANKKLIEIFEKKVKDKIGEVWGE